MSPNTDRTTKDIELEVSVGILQNEVKHIAENQRKIQADQNEMWKDVRSIRDTLTGAKGSWKVVVALGSIVAGILIGAGTRLIDLLSGK